MESYKNSEHDDREKHENRKAPQYSEYEVVNRFRELLQQGNKSEALGMFSKLRMLISNFCLMS
jgi:hypothetical protein